jgi:hypothetical protein
MAIRHRTNVVRNAAKSSVAVGAPRRRTPIVHDYGSRPPDAGHYAIPLFNYPISAHQYRIWYFDSECFCRFEIDNQFELARPLDR